MLYLSTHSYTVEIFLLYLPCFLTAGFFPGDRFVWKCSCVHVRVRACVVLLYSLTAGLGRDCSRNNRLQLRRTFSKLGLLAVSFKLYRDAGCACVVWGWVSECVCVCVCVSATETNLARAMFIFSGMLSPPRSLFHTVTQSFILFS